MKTSIAILFFLFSSMAGLAQSQPKIMVIPFAKDGEDLRTVLDYDVNRRIAITKAKEGFDNQGFTTVDFIGKLKAAKDNQVFTSDNQTDIKTKILEMSGTDIYVVVETNTQSDNSGTAVNVILSAYEVATGNSLANQVGSSGKFYTDDIGRLTAKAVEKCIDEFTQTMMSKFAEIEKNGYAVTVDFSFGENSSYDMTSEVSSNKTALSDAIETWVSENALNGSYHLQGTTRLKSIYDEIKIPLKDKSGNRFTSSKFSLAIINFFKSIGLSASREVKGNTIYITIN